MEATIGGIGVTSRGARKEDNKGSVGQSFGQANFPGTQLQDK